MPHAGFVHLHNHTEYSFLDGAIKIDKLVKKAAEYKMPAMALTDHGGLFGAVEFHQKCIASGIKPIVGCEFYIAPESRTDRSYARGQPTNYHLVLLARDQEGYDNLMKLSSIGYLEGFYYKPRIDKETLEKHASGLVCLSACLKGEIPQLLLKEKYDDAKKTAQYFSKLFGEERFYLEIQDHGIDDELVAFERVIELSKDVGIPLVLTNDTHYLEHKDAGAHEALLCIQTGKTLNDDDRMKFSSDQVYFKSADEMKDLFRIAPEAYSNTLKVAESCNVKIGTDKLMLPSFPLPKGVESENELLRRDAMKGLQERYGKVTPGLEDRLNYELDVICSMNFAGYFLIVMDFTKAAKKKGIYVGCRGSAAASIVAYSLGITDIDPIKFGLIFERFLNPERIEMPDADIDFADRDRSKVIDYVVEKYGRKNVCQIITYGTMKARAVVRDVARVMGLPYADGDKIAKLIPTIPIGISLKKAMDTVSELKDLINSRGDLQKLWEYALVLEGLVRQPGMHAAGIIIAKDSIINFAPLYKPSDSTDVMCQFDMKHVADVGLVKMDFLGLKTLTVLQDAVSDIKKRHDVDIDLWRIPYDDPKAYELFGEGSTIGIFQFESGGMRDYLRKLGPNRIEDLIAMNALYRPGPMKKIDNYIHRKHGVEDVDYLHKSLEPILKESYGIITYQEHVMRIAQVMGGFSLGQADILRKAMGKKKIDIMEKMGKEFIEGATKKGIDEKTAKRVFDLMAEFAQYGFNKAHAAVYAHLAYQSGYLKVHYPCEYMAALLSCYQGNLNDVVLFAQECKRMGIEVLPPDVNESAESFTVVADKKIRFGLGAIKNVGSGAIESIVKTRNEEGPYGTIHDFTSRVDLKAINKRVIESLVMAGAFDSMEGYRSQVFAAIDSAIEYGQTFHEDRLSGQTSLFEEGEDGDNALSAAQPGLPEVPPWPYLELLTREKEVLNLYVSGHPLEKFRDEVTGLSCLHFSKEEFEKTEDNREVIVGGIVAISKKIITKKDGRPMAFVTLEDFYGTIEVVVFSDLYEKSTACFQEDAMIMVSGKFEKREEREKIIANAVIKLEDAREKLARSIHVNLKTAGLEEEHLTEMKNICATKGPCSLVIHVQTRKGDEFSIKARSIQTIANEAVLGKLRERWGQDAVTIGRNLGK